MMHPLNEGWRAIVKVLVMTHSRLPFSRNDRRGMLTVKMPASQVGYLCWPGKLEVTTIVIPIPDPIED